MVAGIIIGEERSIKSNTYLRLVILFMVAACCLPSVVSCHDNQPRFQHLTTKDGLSNNIINCLLQDSKGYLWIGAYDGLNRYDGYNFTHFQHDPKDKYSIPNGPISALLETRNKTIWIATNTGDLCKYDSKKETFTTITALQPLKKNNKLIINVLNEDANGNILIGTYENGLLKYNIKYNTITSFRGSNTNFNKEQVVSVLDDREGKLWIGTYENGFLVYDTNKDLLAPVISKPDDRAMINFSHVQCIYELNKDSLLLGTKNGWAVFNKKARKFTKYGFQPVLNKKHLNISVFAITKDKKGFFWISTNRGVYKFDLKSGKFDHFTHHPLDPSSLSSNLTKYIITDFSNNVWIATEDGLNKIDAHRGNFINYKPVLPNTFSLKGEAIRSVYEDKEGNIWAGTKGAGLIKISQNGIESYLADTKYSEGYGFNYINTIYEDRSGKIWVGSPRGVQYFNKKTKKFTKILYPNMASANWIEYSTWSIFEDDKGIFWFGTQRNGLFSLNPKNGLFINYSKSGTNGLPVISVWSIFQDSNNNLWFGTNKGIYKLTKTNDPKDYFFEETGNHKPNGNNMCGENAWWFHEDKQKNIWISTSDGGLNKIDYSTGNFTCYNTDNGLPSNSLSAILEDNKGLLWISTVNGLCKFDPVTGKMSRNYHIEDGLQDNHFNFKSAFKTANGTMLFGGQTGFIRFHPDSVAFNNFDPYITISSFKVLYNEAKKELLDDSSIILPYHQNSFSFDFASLDLSNPKKNQFRYFLKGFDPEFIEAGTRHFISYTNLDPGEYVFMLEGTNSDGIWSSKNVTFHITILPTFWQTWWFRILIILVLIGLSGILLYLFIKKNVEKRRRVQSELAALRNQLNPHFVFNSLTSLQHFIIENQRSLAIDYLTKFAVLMRMILENSKQPTISIEEEKKFLELYLYMEASRFEHKFGVKIHVDPALNEREVNIPPMLLQPVVENAIKHGLVAKKADGKINVSFIKRNNKSILCIIEDNGVGRKKAMESKARSNIAHQSRSTEIINEKLQLIANGAKNKNRLNYIDLYDVTGNPIGTRAELEIPVNV